MNLVKLPYTYQCTTCGYIWRPAVGSRKTRPYTCPECGGANWQKIASIDLLQPVARNKVIPLFRRYK